MNGYKMITNDIGAEWTQAQAWIPYNFDKAVEWSIEARSNGQTATIWYKGIELMLFTIPDTETGSWVLGHPIIDEAELGAYNEQRDARDTWQVYKRTVYFTNAQLLADELDAMADQLQDMADHESAWTTTAPATAARQANVIRRWADAIRSGHNQ
jgi:hypothetical protein